MQGTRKSKANATVSDVAREAGVALGTVSKVINGLPVGESYRQKVEEAIKKLDYQVNTSAKALKSTRTGMIAMIVPNTISPYFALLTQHINTALEKRGYQMLLCFTNYDSGREQALIQLVRQNRVDGIIALTYNPSLVIPEDISFVTIDRYFSASVPCIASDNFGGGRLAAQKLADLGCRHVACFYINVSLSNEPSKRRDGFIRECTARGLPFEVCNLPDGTQPDALTDALQSFVSDGKFTLDGLFCGTDLLAYQVRCLLTGMGYRVPEDVQIIGFDGIRMFGDLDYTCSTIVQPVQGIAEAAVNMVLAPDFGGLPQLVCLPVTYQPGGTTLDAPAAGTAGREGQP